MKSWSLTTCAVLAVYVIGLALLPNAAHAGRAEDGAAVVRKMEAAYASLKSYSHTMHSIGQVSIQGSKQSGDLVSELRYQAPNRMYLSITSPKVGAVIATTDGKQQVIYFGRRNAVLRLPAPANLMQFLEGLKKFKIAAVLDPLYFVVGESASKLAFGFAVKGEEMINGSLCDRVVGPLKKNAVQTALTGQITLWIDRKTSLIQKTFMELKGVPVRTSSRKDPSLPPVASSSLADETLEEVIVKKQVNPKLTDKDLSAVIPANAKSVGAPVSR